MDTLLVMARVPGSPNAKTRLARDIGAEGARRIYDELLGLALALARSFAVRPDSRAVVLVDGDGEPHEVFEGLEQRRQLDGDLGVRLSAGFDAAFAHGAERAAAVGSDAPELDLALLGQAFDALHTNDVVLGPAADGGYYLIGFSRGVWPDAGVTALTDIPWSDPSTAEVTLGRLADAGLSVAVLPVLADVDTGHDLAEWIKRRAE